MKARSVVFTNIQWPTTVFGMPPKLVALTLGVGVVVYVVMFVIGWVALSFIGFGLVTMVGLYLSFRAGRTDRHIESVVPRTIAFWGIAPRRWLLAGARPVRSRGGRT